MLSGCAGTGAGASGPGIAAFGGGLLVASLSREMVARARRRSNSAVVVSLGALNPASEGARDAAWLKSLGMGQTNIVSFTSDIAAAIGAFETAGLTWFTGGLQSRHVQRMRATRGAVDAVKRMHLDGGTVGGGSAGAALLSETMISGGSRGNVYLRQGLGLWPEVIVDQHVIARNREYRLRKAILRHPNLVGVGIDEGTGVFAQGGQFRVYGRSKVIVVRNMGGEIVEDVLSRGDRYVI